MKKHFWQFAAVLAAITLAAVVAGCGGDKKDIPVTSVTLSDYTKDLVEGIDEGFTLTATVMPANASRRNITWSVDAEGIVELSSTTGASITVKPKAGGDGGTVKIKATADGKSSEECVVTVTSAADYVAVTGVSLDCGDEKELKIGNTLIIKATLVPGNATIQGVTWEIEQEGSYIEEVEKGGLTITVKGLAEGEALVKVTTEDGGKKASASIAVTESGEAGKATVTFHNNGGSSVLSLTVDKNESIDEPENVTGPATELKEGIYLEGWYKEPAYTHKWDFATDKVTADTDLYARWFPKLSTTEWRRLGPNNIGDIIYDIYPKPTNFHQGMAIDPNNTDILYLTVGSHDPDINNGILKSYDRGMTWEWLYKGKHYNGTNNGYMPVNIRVDPSDSDRLYVVEMIAVTDGIKLSTDGGKTWNKHPGWEAFSNTHTLHNNLYHMELDPINPKHLLVTTKGSSGGFGGKWDIWCAIESFDGGDNWNGINKPAGLDMGYGWNTWFLRHPNPASPHSGADGKRMLLGTQEGYTPAENLQKGFYLTDDAGVTWTHIIGPGSSVFTVNTNMQHGGGTVYYDEKGDLFVPATPSYDTPSGQILKSTDNGETWTSFTTGLKSWDPFLFVTGYNGYLYTSPHTGGSDFYKTSTASADWQIMPANNNGWDNKETNKNMMRGGVFEFVIDKANKILYASCTESGVYALQLE
jgi:uncharacterized protein YjdB